MCVKEEAPVKPGLFFFSQRWQRLHHVAAAAYAAHTAAVMRFLGLGGLSSIRVSVVRMRSPIEAALWSAETRNL
jgi:hypothetical protein